jgi:hypothetical protein
MKCDSRASLLARTFASPCFGHEPKVKVATNIHSLLGVVKEKVGDLPLNMCSTLQNSKYENISKCIMGYCTFTFIGTPIQTNTKTQGMGRNSK